jgi:hypothetical protein
MTNPSDPERIGELEKLRELSERATPGEWYASQREPTTVWNRDGDLVCECVDTDRDSICSQQDAAFISASVNYVRAALAAQPTERETNEQIEEKARIECAFRGIDPDAECADGGVTTWMVVAKELQAKTVAPSLSTIERATIERCAKFIEELARTPNKAISILSSVPRWLRELPLDAQPTGPETHEFAIRGLTRTIQRATIERCAEVIHACGDAHAAKFARSGDAPSRFICDLMDDLETKIRALPLASNGERK